MRANSQASLDAALERWDTLLSTVAGDLQELAGDFLKVVDLLETSSGLRRALTDPASPPDAKARLAATVLGGHIAGDVVDLLQGLVRDRWSEECDLQTALANLAAVTVFAEAERRGELPEVAEELFEVGQLLGRERELRDSLGDKSKPDAQRLELLEAVFGGKLRETTMAILRRIVATARHRAIISSLRAHTALAAKRRDRVVAVVTVASPPSKEQTDRVTALLQERYSQDIHVLVSVDPSLLGGMRIAIGDDVVDGSIASRVEAVRRNFSD